MNGAEGAGRMSYSRARQLIVLAGLILLVLIAVFTYMRGVDPKEVTATVLFMPIFVAFVFGRLTGGIIAAVAATAVYAALRYPDIQAVGIDRFSTLIASRALAFLAFGAIGGWATRNLEASVNKLELYDQIDDMTGLYNARFFVQDTDLEVTRSTRYSTIFSVTVVDIASQPLEVLSRRQRAGLLKELGRIMRSSVRTVDRVVHALDGRRHRLACVLPETGREGARIFVDRLGVRITEYLAKRGVDVGSGLTTLAFTFPEDEEGVRKLLDEFGAIARVEHPEPSEADARIAEQRS